MDQWDQVHRECENVVSDLSLIGNAYSACDQVKWVFNLAADMGGMGFIESNKALCMLSSLINTHMLLAARDAGVERYFYASSACVYASWHQTLDGSIALAESAAYPADPEDGYGWEKLFAERMCRHFSEDFGLEVRIARYHNVYGPQGTYEGGREKAPAAASRKLAELTLGQRDMIEMWGDGSQVRSFTYIDDCIDGTLNLMASDWDKPINIGSSESVTIQHLYDLVAKIAGADSPKYIYDLNAPLGVPGRSSDNSLCKEVLDWEPITPLIVGMEKTYTWVRKQVERSKLN